MRAEYPQDDEGQQEDGDAVCRVAKESIGRGEDDRGRGGASEDPDHRGEHARLYVGREVGVEGDDEEDGGEVDERDHGKEQHEEAYQDESLRRVHARRLRLRGTSVPTRRAAGQGGSSCPGRR